MLRRLAVVVLSCLTECFAETVVIKGATVIDVRELGTQCAMCRMRSRD